MIRMIAFDLDGTLLNSNKKISERTKNILEKCAKQGILIMPSTGRTVGGIPASVKNIVGVKYAITVNGAVLVDMEKGQIIDEAKFTNEEAIALMEEMSQYNLMYDAYVDGRGVSESRFYDHYDDFKIEPEIQKVLRETRDVYPDTIEYIKNTGKAVEKINLYFADLEERERVRNILKDKSNVITSASLYNNLELNTPAATKGEAIIKMTEHLGIKLEEVMAFGDGENDITMIKQAGIGVAMGNAADILKECADYVTKTNDEDGIADAIEKFIDLK